MKIKILGVCDFPNCTENAIWQTGQIQDKKTNQVRLGIFCEKHKDGLVDQKK